MERARQLLGDVLIGITLVIVAGGAYLGSHYAITDDVVSYSGTYGPLQGVEMSAAYESVLTANFEVPGGLLVRQVHDQYGTVLLVGLVIWAVIGRFRYALPAFALALVASFSGMQLREGNGPVPLWFAGHIGATLAMATIMVVSSWREAKERPISIGYVGGVLGLLVAAGLF
ncbi:hypothetical protein [Herbidospora sp. NBRC 101105]|uniref:hypothetical protein n=1 Tax=Herbidospora sp. NBRC 101105 TaxID=3032195 RepID=UPI0024A2CA60|nr:hypothetical protein [Herbidospora sp. NBRC 101105]GLX96083.1 hypothetical protein Hesp01_40330 [Herbidospora sp. NBRC 101105]